MNAAQLHLLTVHLPVFGMFAGLVLMSLALVRGSEGLVRTALGFVVCGTVLGAPAYFSGPGAMEVAEGFVALDEHLVEQHAIVARGAFFASVILAAVGLKVWLDSRRGATGAGVRVGLLLAMLVIAWLMAWTAHLGGVIRHAEIREPSWWWFPDLPR